MAAASIEITVGLVANLIRLQFPEWANLPVAPVARAGWDNRSFRLGHDLVVRLPSSEAYASQVEREHRWLPVLAASVPLPIPTPVALGEPALGYPCRWSVYRWLHGDPAEPGAIREQSRFAQDLAAFLRALESVPSEGGPTGGLATFHRGGSLAAYDDQARKAFAVLASSIDVRCATEVWDRALASRWVANPVWVHGDMSVGNLLVDDGALCGVIDFGQACIGDPACDLVPAWTLFRDRSRVAFREALQLDSETWARGRGWALWKAAIIEAGLVKTNAWEASHSRATIAELFDDHNAAAT